MQKNSDTKAGAIVAASIIVILFSLAIGFFIMMMVGIGDILVSGFFLLYIIIEAAVIIGVLIALKQRLKELNGDETEKAKKY